MERVADVADDHAQQGSSGYRAAPAPGGSACTPRSAAADHDPLAGLGPDRDAGLVAVQDPRDRRDRDAGPLRDVAQRDRAAIRPRPPRPSRPLDTADYRSDGAETSRLIVKLTPHRSSSDRAGVGRRAVERRPAAALPRGHPGVRFLGVTQRRWRARVSPLGDRSVASERSMAATSIAAAAQLRPPALRGRHDGRPPGPGFEYHFDPPSRRRPRGSRRIELGDARRSTSRHLPGSRAVSVSAAVRRLDVAKFFAWRRGRAALPGPDVDDDERAVRPPRGTPSRRAAKVGLGWAIPEAVYVDVDVIRSAPPPLNRSGVGDVLCHHTAHCRLEARP